jgi:hypothetical protein
MWLDYLAEHEAEEFLDDEDQEAQYEGYSDFCATTEAEWSREYQNAFNEFEQKKERWEAEFEERKRESETRPMQTQEDILEELDDDWPGLQKHTRDYAAQIVETLNKLFHTHKQHTLNKLLNKIARVNQGKQEEFSLERLTQLHFAAQYSALPVSNGNSPQNPPRLARALTSRPCTGIREIRQDFPLFHTVLSSAGLWRCQRA